MARQTFRPIVAGEPAWQKQLRDRYADEPAPEVDLDLGTARVRRISRDLAAKVILRYEWLGTMPHVSLAYGIFFGPYLAGATVIAIGNGSAGANTANQYGVAGRELATLVRGACVHWAPPGTNSKLVSWTARLLATDRPDAKVLVAYADTEAGEIGTIYQACGWTYVGPGSRVVEWIAPSGRVLNQATIMTRRRRLTTTAYGAALRAKGWRPQRSNPKHRYVRVLTKDPAVVARIEAMGLPYPKRDVTPAVTSGRGESDDAPAYQVGEDASRRSARSNARPNRKRPGSKEAPYGNGPSREVPRPAPSRGASRRPGPPGQGRAEA